MKPMSVREIGGRTQTEMPQEKTPIIDRVTTHLKLEKSLTGPRTIQILLDTVLFVILHFLLPVVFLKIENLSSEKVILQVRFSPYDDNNGVLLLTSTTSASCKHRILFSTYSLLGFSWQKNIFIRRTFALASRIRQAGARTQILQYGKISIRANQIRRWPCFAVQSSGLQIHAEFVIV